MPLNPAITDWRGKRVWLVGASSGIGRAVAAQLHAQGAQVIVSARQQALLAAFAHEHPGSQAVVLDVTDAQAVLDVAARLQTESPLDLVCYCAGHYTPMRADTLALPELLRHQQVNLTGALHVLAAVVPGLLASAQAGRVPHLSLVASVAGWRGLPQSLAYGPTKAALINLAETLFLDLRPQGVGVSVVNPGFVDTPLTRQNDFNMPALLTPEQAAQAILRGWGRGAFELHFPRRFTLWLKLLRVLPYRWYFPLVHRMTGL
ncbi:SDR family NAD(P)-dependent oxidoreductase [Diaphorobacter sp. C33]|uniref:Short-subunit dehydrogenase n=1 Tax=Diaphorobacter nitroreducens TaxID=164759 RepID=A0AAX1WWT6_9BURK|nr:SDR family NAD(P)-dependent oxidoreductase [Diaphorobacter sp. C33]ROR47375.1 short-subunit dehydrogenase [Diaphorobacter nitroreducens]WKK91158.1 SDR family NAD(P)-dependent oxidoreductase [Diaphorobacter sp. C33]